MREKYVALALVGLSLSGVAAAALFVPAATHPPGVAAPVGSNPGDRAPEVSATTLSGSRATLASLRGHRVVLTFWATWCPACLVELPELERMARLHPELRIVAVESDSSRSQVVAMARRLHLAHIAVWRDPSATTLHERYHSYGIPATFVIDAGGRIENSFAGAVEDEQALELALFGLVLPTRGG